MHNEKQSKRRGSFMACMVLIVLLLLSACQPTPKQDIVVGAGNAEVRQKDAYLLADTLATVPGKWQIAPVLFGEGRVSVSIDAEIVYPNIDKIAVPEVAAEAIDVQVLERLMGLFRDGVKIKLYPQDDDLAPKATKQEIVQMMQEVSDALSAADRIEGKTEEELAYIREDLEAHLSDLQKSYNDAPDASEIQYCSFAELAYLPAVKADLVDTSDKKFGELFLQACGRDEDDKRRSQLYINAERGRAICSEPITMAEDATQVAQEMLAVLALSEVYAIVSVDEGPAGFWVNFGRHYKKLCNSPLVSAEIAWDSSFNLPWQDETMRICLDRKTEESEGITLRAASWYGNSRIVSDITENAVLLPFSEVQEQALQSLKNNYAWLPNDVQSREIMITKISLGYKRVSIKESENRYMLIPVWTFQGSIMDTNVMDDGSVRDPYPHDFPQQVLMVLSAIDASLLYRYAG